MDKGVGKAAENYKLDKRWKKWKKNVNSFRHKNGKSGQHVDTKVLKSRQKRERRTKCGQKTGKI